MYPLTDSDREILRTLVGMALENRFSALRELTDEAREQLYVVFAKLTSELDPVDASQPSEPRQEPAASEAEPEPEPRPWAATNHVVRRNKPE